MLTTTDKTWIRAYITDNMLPDTAVIKRDSGSVNSNYEYVESSAAVGTVACRLDPFNRADSSGIIAEADKTKSYYQLTVPHDTDLRANDTVTVNSLEYTVYLLRDEHSHNFTVRAVLSVAE